MSDGTEWSGLSEGSFNKVWDLSSGKIENGKNTTDRQLYPLVLPVRVQEAPAPSMKYFCQLKSRRYMIITVWRFEVISLTQSESMKNELGVWDSAF